MRNIIRQTVNAAIAAAILAAVFFRFDGIANYIYMALAVCAAVALFNWVMVSSAAKASSDRAAVILPVLLVAGFFASSAAVSSLGIRLLIAVGAALFLYFYQLYPPAHKPIFIEESVSLLTAFLLFLAVWGFNFFFAPDWWIIVLLNFVLSFLFFYQLYARMVHGRYGLLLSLVAALFMAEVAWALLFWPVYFLTLAVVSFAAAYLFYMISILRYENRLDRKLVYFHTGIISVVVFLSLITSAWQP